MVSTCLILVAGALVVVDSRKVSQSQRVSHWKLHSSPGGSEEHDIVFAVRQNVEILERELLEVSTPGNPRFRQHLTFEEVGALAQSRPRSDRVKQWVDENVAGARIIKQSPRGEYIRVRATVGSWEKVLNTSFHNWNSQVLGRNTLRCESYSLPSTISDDVHSLLGAADFPPVLRHGPQPKADRDWSNSINPEILNKFYQIDSNFGSADVGQSVFETSDEGYSPTDLAYFQGHFGLDMHEVSLDIGGHNTSAPCNADINTCAESNLDVQYLMGVSRVTPTTFFWTPDADAVFVTYLETMAELEHPPEVNSISWGGDEPETPGEIMDLFNTEAMKLGLMGVSVFVSSGDDGVGSRGWTSRDECGYVASYPASSPYVTAVGATAAHSWDKPGQGEIVCQMNVMGGVITSGGGFSEHYAMPVWQKDAVSKYFATVKGTRDPVRGYNVTGRAYPDLALSGYGYETVLGGHLYHMFGTSASAPTVAAMVSLVNAVRKAAGASTVGFLNPSIYEYGMVGKALGVFNDVTEGQNQCTSGGVCCSEGFYAAEGWDPTTGFGSINFQAFKAALTSDIDPMKLKHAEELLQNSGIVV